MGAIYLMDTCPRCGGPLEDGDVTKAVKKGARTAFRALYRMAEKHLTEDSAGADSHEYTGSGDEDWRDYTDAPPEANADSDDAVTPDHDEAITPDPSHGEEYFPEQEPEQDKEEETVPSGPAAEEEVFPSEPAAIQEPDHAETMPAPEKDVEHGKETGDFPQEERSEDHDIDQEINEEADIEDTQKDFSELKDLLQDEQTQETCRETETEKEETNSMGAEKDNIQDNNAEVTGKSTSPVEKKAPRVIYPDAELSEEALFEFYKVMKMAYQETSRKNQKLYVTVFFGQYLKNRPACSKDRLGIQKYGQIYKALSVFSKIIPPRAKGEKAYFVFRQNDKYERMVEEELKKSPPADRRYFPDTDRILYVQVASIRETRVLYKSHGTETERTSSSPLRWLKDVYPDPTEGMHLWVIRRKPKKGLEYDVPLSRDKSTLGKETDLLKAICSPGDVLFLPVSDVKDDRVSFSMGPIYRTSVFTKNIPLEIIKGIRVGNVYAMRVDAIKEKQGKYGDSQLLIDLSFTDGTILAQSVSESGTKNIEQDHHVMQSSARSSVGDPSPEEVGYIPASDGIFNAIHEEERFLIPFEEKLGVPLTKAKITEFVMKKYKEAYDNSTLVTTRRGSSVGVSVPLDIKDIRGVPLDAYVNKNRGRDTFFLATVSSSSPGDELRRRVWIQDFDASIWKLRDLALPEDWDHGYGEGSNFVLKNYFIHSFYKVYVDGNIYSENGYSVFNTGLVDINYDDIYCCLKENDGSDALRKKQWDFQYFAVRGSGADGKKLNSLFSTFPSPPLYINESQYNNLFYNTEKELACDYHHIIKDNFKRIPDFFVLEKLAYDEHVRELYAKKSDESDAKKIKEISETIRQYVINNDDLVRSLQAALEHHVQVTIKSIRSSYNIAVPIYYSRTNGISLLLPLRLRRNSTKVDIALVVERLANGNYQGQTILTPAMAKLDARQICRANLNWD